MNRPTQVIQVNFIKGDTAKINATELVHGQVLFDTEAKVIYLDTLEDNDDPDSLIRVPYKSDSSVVVDRKPILADDETALNTWYYYQQNGIYDFSKFNSYTYLSVGELMTGGSPATVIPVDTYYATCNNLKTAEQFYILFDVVASIPLDRTHGEHYYLKFIDGYENVAIVYTYDPKSGVYTNKAIINCERYTPKEGEDDRLEGRTELAKMNNDMTRQSNLNTYISDVFSAPIDIPVGQYYLSDARGYYAFNLTTAIPCVTDKERYEYFSIIDMNGYHENAGGADPIPTKYGRMDIWKRDKSTGEVVLMDESLQIDIRFYVTPPTGFTNTWANVSPLGVWCQTMYYSPNNKKDYSVVEITIANGGDSESSETSVATNKMDKHNPIGDGSMIMNQAEGDSQFVGQYSTSLGYHSRAVGNQSIAVGYECQAYGDNSVAMGKSTKTMAKGAIALGADRNYDGAILPAKSVTVHSTITCADMRQLAETATPDAYKTTCYGLFKTYGVASTDYDDELETLGWVEGEIDPDFVDNLCDYMVTESGDDDGTTTVEVVDTIHGATASGIDSFACNVQTLADGWASIASGAQTEAYGMVSIATGMGNKTTGYVSIVGGTENEIKDSNYSVLLGANNSIENGQINFVYGYSNLVGMGVDRNDHLACNTVFGSSHTLYKSGLTAVKNNFVAGSSHSIDGADSCVVAGRNNSVPDAFSCVVLGKGLSTGDNTISGTVVVGQYNDPTKMVAGAKFIVGNGVSENSLETVFQAGGQTNVGDGCFIQIGETKITETQLKALLALLS